MTPSREEPAGPDDTLIETAEVSCPYCGEQVELILDPGGGADQEYVEDCEVCCRPWQVHVRFRDSSPSVDVRTLSEG